MKNIRIKKKKEEKKIVFDSLTPEQRIELDKSIIDVVLKILFDNSDLNEVDFQKDVINKANVIFPQKEVERLWDVLRSSAWVTPLIGFGKAGKLEMTNTGYQMMSQFGSYKNYLQTINAAGASVPMEGPTIQKTEVKPKSNETKGHEL